MRRRWISLVTLVAMLVLPCLSTLSVEAPLPSNVATWSVLDVERWMNYTIGYAEYIPTIRLHAIDGPTLLYLSSREVEDHFNIANSIHLAKIRAHLQLLRGSCACPRQSSKRRDFWASLKEDNARTWIFGVSVLFLPRAALVGAYLFDGELFSVLYAEPQTTLDQEVFSSLATHEAEAASPADEHSAPWSFLFMALVCPNVLLLVKCAYFFDANYVLVSVALLHFAICQYNELGIIYLTSKGKLLDADDKKSAKRMVVALLKILVGFSPAFPIVAFVTSYFVPYFLQQLTVGVFVVYVVLCSIGVAAMALKHFSSSDSTASSNGEQPGHEQKHD